jgi:hypothetical protein
MERKKYVSYASTVKNEKLPGKHLPVCLHFFLFLYWKSSLFRICVQKICISEWKFVIKKNGVSLPIKPKPEIGRADPTHLGRTQERQMRHFPKLAGEKKFRILERLYILNFWKKKGDPQLFSRGWAGLSSEWCGLQCIYYALSKTSKIIGIFYVVIM